jgi:striatin 1/3/4
MVAHSDSVTSLCARNSEPAELISCSHDSTLRVWDIRKFKCISDVGIHMRKYDESLLCLAYSNEDQLVAVGGGDGQIKLLGPDN